MGTTTRQAIDRRPEASSRPLEHETPIETRQGHMLRKRGAYEVGQG
jgi:hypothetical protein